jgi:hypothetical protein
MTNQAQGRKESAFAATTTLPSAAYLTYFASGINYKIDLTSFNAAIGATGSIAQKGAATGTPVLDKQGSVNGIRNLENGPGVKASVSAYNGITLAHNFTVNTTGVPLMLNKTLASPTIPSLVAGSGISVAASGSTVVISASATPVSTKTVVVSTEADFPAAVAGVITLVVDVDYLVVKDISTSNRFVSTGTNIVRASSASLVTLTYTGSGDMFTVSNANFKLSNIGIDCPSGRIFNIAAYATGRFQVLGCNFGACATIGTVAGVLLTRFDSVAFEGITTGGLTFTGAHSNLSLSNMLLFLNGGTFCNLGTATFGTVNIRDLILQTSAGGTTLLSGAASSANITAGGLGVVSNCRLAGSATALSGITTDDSLWNFALNDDIENTRQDGLLSMQANATDTVIATINTPVLVAGTWVVQEAGQMTGTTAGRLTSTSGRGTHLPITASLSIAPVSGSNKTLSVYVAVNGSVITASKRTAVVSSTSIASVTLPWKYDLQPTDYIEVFVENNTDAVDILVSSAILRVN